jgi:hypothetical protein
LLTKTEQPQVRNASNNNINGNSLRQQIGNINYNNVRGTKADIDKIEKEVWSRIEQKLIDRNKEIKNIEHNDTHNESYV